MKPAANAIPDRTTIDRQGFASAAVVSDVPAEVVGPTVVSLMEASRMCAP
jgi:hypothetical protein